MAKLITDGTRKAIKKMAEISQCARALSLMPTAEDFAMRLVGDLKIIAERVNSLSTRINGMLDKYSSIPGEFLLKGFDEILEKLENISDYSKFAINETMGVVTSTLESTKATVDSVGDAASSSVSAVLQIGGVWYGASKINDVTNVELNEGDVLLDIDCGVVKINKDGKVEVGNVREKTENFKEKNISLVKNTTESIDNWVDDTFGKESIEIETDENGNEVEVKKSSGLNQAIEWSENVKKEGNELVDDTIGDLIEKVENAKKGVEEKIQKVRDLVNKLTKEFDDAFGFISPKNALGDVFDNISATAYSIKTQDYDDENSVPTTPPVYEAIGEVSSEIANFINNFSIGKAITAFGGMVITAGAATLAMDLLPSVNVDRMLKEILSGIDTHRIDKITELQYNKYYETEPDLLEVPDVPWRLSKDDLEKYESNAYKEFLKKYEKSNNEKRAQLLNKMQSESRKDRRAARKENRQLMKEDENKSALKEMRKIRRDVIKAKQIEKYKGFFNIELDYLKRDLNGIKNSISREWDHMMSQYRTAIAEIKRFFTKDGYGGNDAVDRCCDRINDDADQIVELCKNLPVQLTNTLAMVPTPYAVGFCVDMPVHKILAFFKDVKIIITFLKNLIRLGIDIISQLTILAKLIFNGLQSLADILKTLKELIGVDKIFNMIDFVIGLFRPKMLDAKLLIENSLSPIYYNETEDYENRLNNMIEISEDGGVDSGVDIEKFKYTDDVCARKKYKIVYGGETNDEDKIDEWIEELESKGEREIVAYRSPLLTVNDDGELIFKGWNFYHAYAYKNMNKSWKDSKKRRRNKLIKNASKKNRYSGGRLYGGVAQLKKNKSFGKYDGKKYKKNSVTGYDAYWWYTKITEDVTDCIPNFNNLENIYDEDGNIIGVVAINKQEVSSVVTTENGSVVELSDGRRVFVKGEIVKSGDYVNVDGVKYRVK